MASPKRPERFAPGTHLSEHYTVEGLVRLSEGRMFYLANDDRPDRPRRFCWACGNDDTPRAASNCVSCGADMLTRRFLVSVRWDRDGFHPYADYFEKRIDHPGFAVPVDMFFQDAVLCSVTLWNGEGLLLDEAAPLTWGQVTHLAQRIAGLLASLHHHGICLDGLSCANFLVWPDGNIQLFDPNIREVYEGPVPEEERVANVMAMGELLRRYCPVEAWRLADFFALAEQAQFPTTFAFGRALEPFLREGGPAERHIATAMTDVGLERALNEDNWGWGTVADGVELFVVADGMGGHDRGEVASRIASETIVSDARERFAAAGPSTPERLENVLEESFQRGNNRVKEYSEEVGSDMGTTMVATLLYQDRLAYVANVGDSRAYLLRNGVLHQITRDHSIVARMVEQGKLKPEEARFHPLSNYLWRTVGSDRNVDIDIFSVEVEPGDKIMMCSDGLWGEADDEEIESVLNHYDDTRVACRELIRAAHHGGGKDNITVLIITVPARR
ncbi:MAG: hypothetical protein RL071_2085 [Pseudomonadota bacterium]|jgi:protein phosphatase